MSCELDIIPAYIEALDTAEIHSGLNASTNSFFKLFSLFTPSDISKIINLTDAHCPALLTCKTANFRVIALLKL